MQCRNFVTYKYQKHTRGLRKNKRSQNTIKHSFNNLDEAAQTLTAAAIVL